MSIEVNFPRGGTPKLSLRTTEQQQNNQFSAISDSLDNKKGTKRAFGKARNTPLIKKSKSDTDDLYQNIFRQSITAELLSQNIRGLAFVKSIKGSDVKLECVDGIELTLPANQISRTLGDDICNTAAIIQAIFHKGQAFAFKVVEIIKNKDKKATICNVTVCPYTVNSHLIPSTLVAGSVLNGIIQSIEEKGVIIDLGFSTSSVKGFVQREDLPSYLSPEFMHAGQVALFRVKEKPTLSTRVIKLTGFVEMDTLDETTSIDTKQLMPGTIVHVEPEKIVSDGVFVNVKNGPKAYIRKAHLPPRLSIDPARITKSFKACVLCVQPNTSMLVLSAHPDVVALSKIEKRLLPPEIKIGSRIDCIVYHMDKKQNAYFRLEDENDKQTLTAKCLRINIDENKLSEFSIGSEHKCRVISYLSVERQLLVSTRTTDLTRKVIAIEDALPGTKLCGIIKAVRPNGLVVDTGNGLTGFVGEIHVLDQPTKNWQKRFQKGQKILTRILFTDLDSNRLMLTAKPSMVKIRSNDKLITSLDKKYEGSTSTGVVIKRLESGSLLIAFYNRVAGILNQRIHMLSNEQIQIGTSIRVLIKKVDSANGQIALDLPSEVVMKMELNGGVDAISCNAISMNERKIAEQIKKPQDPTRRKLIQQHAKPFRIYTATVVGPWPYGGTSPMTSAELLFPGGSVGRLHVSELNNLDEYPEGSCPMQQFLSRNKGRVINVKVLYVSKNKSISKSGRELLLELRQSDRIVECTVGKDKLQEARKKLTLLNYRSEFYAGDIVSLFITTNPANKKCLYGEINPNFTGIIPWDRIMIPKLRERINEVKDLEQEGMMEIDTEDFFDGGELRYGRVIGVNKTKRGKIVNMDLVSAPSDVRVTIASKSERTKTKPSLKKGDPYMNEENELTNLLEVKDEPVTSEQIEEAEEETNSDEQCDEEEMAELELDLNEMQGERYQTAEEYEKLIKVHPNSVLHWIGYIQFYLLRTKPSARKRYDLGKGIAERALKTISFQNDAGLTALWQVYLNLEVVLGTEESLQQCFKRACAATRSIDMHRYLIHLLEKQPNAEGREEEIRSNYESMINKFRHVELEPWFAYARHLLKRGDVDDSRKLLTRALQCTEKKKHLTILNKFTQLEERFGDKERAKTMQELIKTFKESGKQIDVQRLENAISGKHGRQI